MTKHIISVVIADDHPGYRAGVSGSLSASDRFKVIGEAENGKEALTMALGLRPDVLLLDMSMPLMEGVDVARSVIAEDPGIMVLPLSGFSDPEYVFGVLDAGAQGYIMKDEPLEVILEAVERVYHGGVFLSSRVSLEIVDDQRRKHRSQQQIDATYQQFVELSITPRLLMILKLVAEGLTNKEIADIVYRSEHTIRNQVEALKELTNVRWRPALVSWAWQNSVKLIEQDEYEKLYKRWG